MNIKEMIKVSMEQNLNKINIQEIIQHSVNSAIDRIDVKYMIEKTISNKVKDIVEDELDDAIDNFIDNAIDGFDFEGEIQDYFKRETSLDVDDIGEAVYSALEDCEVEESIKEKLSDKVAEVVNCEFDNAINDFIDSILED